MQIPPRRWRAPSVLALVAALAVAGGAAAAEPPVRAARVLGRHVEAGYETLVVSVDAGACADPWNRGWQVRLDGVAGEPTPWSGVATQPYRDAGTVDAATVAASPAPARPTLTVVIRRMVPSADPAPKVPGLLHLYAPADCGSRAAPTGEHLRFTLPDSSGLPDDPRAMSTYLVELGQKLRFGSPFGAFAQARLHALAEERFRALAPAPPPRPSRQELRKLGVVGFGYRDVGTAPARTPAAPRRTAADLARLMATTADATLLQELLQQDRRLAAFTANEAAPVPIDKLAGPTSVARPWQELLARLPIAAPSEPLADAAPADFYYARFARLTDLYRLLDGLDDWLTRASALAGSAAAGAGIASTTPIDRALVARYLTELGLPSAAGAAALAPAISGEVAVLGSDPYLREGSDVTLIWRARAGARRGPGAPAPADPERALAAALADLAAGHGGVVAAEREEGGVVVHADRSGDGAIHRYRASAGGFELLSNSAGAVRRVLAAIAGHEPRLGDQRAFRYLLARDAATPADVLFFAGDRFVARVAGPRWKVLEARRQIALGELETPGLAALLLGWLDGRAPASADELLASGLLSRDELARVVTYGAGDTPVFSPGAAPRTAWGTPAALTPLIDLPAPAMVTATERDAYRMFVDGYERDWRANLGPFALRMAWRRGATGPVDIDLRLAPFSRDDGSAWAALAPIAGDARLASGRTTAGVRAALGIGTAAEPRRWIRQLLAPALPGRPSSSDWLGDWVMAGVDESPAAAMTGVPLRGRTGLLDLAELLRPVPAGGGPRLDLPVYAGVAVRDEAAADLFLRSLRASLGPVPIDARPLGAHRGIAITRVERRLARDAGARVPLFPPIYYAVCRSTLTAALGEETLRHRIDDCLDGRLPRLEAKPKVKRAEAGADSSPGAQLVADVDLPSGGALSSIAGGLIEQLAAPDDGASAAEAIFRGAPGLDAAGARALAMAYLGGAPVTPEGSAYHWSEAGVVDPMRGSAHAPRATAGKTPAERLDPGLRAWVDALAHARLEISFDGEPAIPGGAPMQSAHLHLTVRRGH